MMSAISLNGINAYNYVGCLPSLFDSNYAVTLSSLGTLKKPNVEMVCSFVLNAVFRVVECRILQY